MPKRQKKRHFEANFILTLNHNFIWSMGEEVWFIDACTLLSLFEKCQTQEMSFFFKKTKVMSNRSWHQFKRSVHRNILWLLLPIIIIFKKRERKKKQQRGIFEFLHWARIRPLLRRFCGEIIVRIVKSLLTITKDTFYFQLPVRQTSLLQSNSRTRVNCLENTF